LAREAIAWFDRAIELNPFDPYAHLRRGMCLDWLGQVGQATRWFAIAKELDPNGYYTVAHLGWHALYLDDYAEARAQFSRSLRLKPHQKEDDNPIAASYLAIVDRRLSERAAGDWIPTARPAQ
jgi:Flp pilus assembly protein TadD